MKPLNFKKHLSLLRIYCEKNGFKGWDPYDGLNSPFTKNKLFENSFILRFFWIQFFKRFPLNLRPILLIKKEYNPKGIALFLSGYCNLYSVSRESSILEVIKFLSTTLLKHKNDMFSGACWGYNFPWQNRSAYLPTGYPTVVTTSFAANALMDAFNCTKNQEYLDAALSSCKFILKDLKKTKIGKGFVFSYTPMKRDCVYNASLLGSRLLSRAFHYTNSTEYLFASKASLLGVISHQNSNGSWYYGRNTNQKWIDSFHTGFNLECISEYQKYTKDNSFSENIVNGFDYYINNFFFKQ